MFVIRARGWNKRSRKKTMNVNVNVGYHGARKTEENRR
jgi:hypothetical protein